MQRYEIQVVGHIDPRQARSLGCDGAQPLASGCCVLTFGAADQAALYGLLTRLRDLGLELVALRRSGEPVPFDEPRRQLREVFEMRGLYRSRQRVLAGVAAGVGERFGINPGLLRVAWSCSIPFTAGLSVLAYLVLAAVLPVAPQNAAPARGPALLPQAFAAFVLAHGLVHGMGFLPAWHLPAPGGFEYTTLVFYSQVDLGDGGAQALGLAWLAVTVAYVAAAVLLWRSSPHAALVTALVSAASAAICAIALPLAPVGLVIDLVLIATVVVAPRLVVARPAHTTFTAVTAHWPAR